MDLLRTLLLRHRAMAALVLACALAVKLLVPAGYMPVGATKWLAVSICAEATGGATVRHIAIPLKQGHGDAPGKHVVAEAVCSYAAAASIMTVAADAPLLALALTLIVLLGVTLQSPPAPRAAPYLRPPPCGPPLAS